ncbi:MAG TPA: M20/M25/M40 family metallo-hydrolase, partial [Bryobacteraceae bacterium]|nr:M20/M25/M40 family metallo-hydrolase [Bryobacteraceae bacterium]
TGHLPLNLKFLFEGEEEILSPDMPAFIQANRARLACDLVVSADGWQWSETESDLRVGLRGVCSLEIDVTGPLRDLHAGSHGGAVANPIHALTAMLASLRDAEGRIQVPGFLDRVRPLTAAERASLASIPFDEEAYRTGLGVPALAGEPGFSPRERIGTRPTIEVNGIWGGYAGPGVKTIVPASAHAKLTCRLVADQRPDESAAAVVRHLERAAPLGVRATVRILPNAGWPYEASADHPGYRAARDVLVGLYGREPYYTRSGGSIPIVSLFHQELGVPTVIFGFGLPDENFHAPDEFFRLASFRRGQTAYVRLLLRLGDRESWKTA